MEEFEQAQELLLDHAGSAVYYFEHDRFGEEIAVFARNLPFREGTLRNAGLVFRLDMQKRVGFWKMDRGGRYFSEKPGFVAIRTIAGEEGSKR